jgi:hypothetical protein
MDKQQNDYIYKHIYLFLNNISIILFYVSLTENKRAINNTLSVLY